MADYKVEFPVIEARDFFTVHAAGVTVSGPLQDLSLQLTFGDEYLRSSKMTVSADSLPDNPALSNVKIEVDAQTVRLVYGSVKVNIATAKELARLLDEYIKKAEDVIKASGVTP